MAIGLATMMWILPGARTIGSVAFDVNTLLYAAAATFIGFQSIIFAGFTKIYGVSEGLLPEDPRLTAAFRWVKLETGLVVGVVMAGVGFFGSAWAVSDWGATSFGELDPQRTLRLVVPATLALTLGFQVILSSFFLSVLGLSRKRG